MSATSTDNGIDKKALLAEFDRPKVVQRSTEEIAEDKADYIQVVASFALEGDEPSDFGKIVAMEEIRGELTEEQASKILGRLIPEETTRIETKIARMHELGLSWTDL